MPQPMPLLHVRSAGFRVAGVPRNRQQVVEYRPWLQQAVAQLVVRPSSHCPNPWSPELPAALVHLAATLQRVAGHAAGEVPVGTLSVRQSLVAAPLVATVAEPAEAFAAAGHPRLVAAVAATVVVPAAPQAATAKLVPPAVLVAPEEAPVDRIRLAEPSAAVVVRNPRAARWVDQD